MESPVVLDKPPEYHGNNERGFPFDEEEGSGAWSELAARHPDIAARLRQRPASATWARKRRPSSQDATDDFGESFSGFDRFPFDDIPPEFREHFPSHWNRRFSDRDQPPPDATHSHAHTHTQAQAPQSPQPQQHTAATQTEHEPEPAPEHSLPQYGLRNTVDLGQRSPADPCVDADERTPRSMSAPPDAPRADPTMSANQQEPPHAEQHSNVRHIPIFVEGRDEPVINKNVDHATHFGETKPAPAPHVDRDQYFADDGPVGFHHPPNFTRAFGTPFNKGFRPGPQPFTQQKAYPQSAFARGASPQRSQSPKPPPPHAHHPAPAAHHPAAAAHHPAAAAHHPAAAAHHHAAAAHHPAAAPEEHFVKVPVQHEHAPSHAEPPSRAHKPAPPPARPSPQREETPPPRPPPASNDPITQILSIQTDVLNLMTEVENFKGTKKDKRYLFLDEMLTRNLIKLDTIETDGKENIRQARKEAIRCIQKCIAVLEAKADGNSASFAPPAQDVEMQENAEAGEPELVTENGDVEIKEAPKEEEKVDSQPERIVEPQPPKQEQAKREATPKPQEETQEQKTEAAPSENTETHPAADTRPEETKPDEKTDEQKKEVENKPSPKKKVVKKRDKSNDNKEAAKDSNTEVSKDSNKAEEVGEKIDVMQVDDKGDKVMEVDGAASQ